MLVFSGIAAVACFAACRLCVKARKRRKEQRRRGRHQRVDGDDADDVLPPGVLYDEEVLYDEASRLAMRQSNAETDEAAEAAEAEAAAEASTPRMPNSSARRSSPRPSDRAVEPEDVVPIFVESPRAQRAARTPWRGAIGVDMVTAVNRAAALARRRKAARSIEELVQTRLDACRDLAGSTGVIRMAGGACVICCDVLEDDTHRIALAGCANQAGACVGCVKSYVYERLGDATNFPVKCWCGCAELLRPDVVESVSSEPETHRRYLRHHLRATIGYMVGCPCCDNVLVAESEAGIHGRPRRCASCKKLVCVDCVRAPPASTPMLHMRRARVHARVRPRRGPTSSRPYLAGGGVARGEDLHRVPSPRARLRRRERGERRRR